MLKVELFLHKVVDLNKRASSKPDQEDKKAVVALIVEAGKFK